MRNINLVVAIYALLQGIALFGQENKIVILIAPPRSLSTAFLRMMEARKDFVIMNEPSQYAWHLSEGRKYVLDGFEENERPPISYEEVKAEIFKRAEHSNVFAKEMGLAVCNFLLNDKELVNNPNVYFVFLIRDPHATILSNYKKIGSLERLYCPFSTLVGYAACYTLFDHFAKNGVRRPHVLRAEDLYDNAEPTVSRLCDYLEIEHKPEALHWESKGKEFTGKEEWNEFKDRSGTQTWHDVALQSTGFVKAAHTYAVNENGLPTFAEVKNAAHRKKCFVAFKDNWPYYRLLMREVKR